MSIGSLLKRLLKAVPVILSQVPALLDVVKDVKQAIKKPDKTVPAATAPDSPVSTAAPAPGPAQT